MKSPWFSDHSNLVTLTSYMAANGYTAEELAYAVEKPWKYEDEFLQALTLELNNSEEDYEDE